ncbi:MAG: nucleoside diphosphate kinase regulator [Clostridiales bacterium]|nr:nucleoside diphosphate kinase regulator [Clostridiales bacterium]
MAKDIFITKADKAKLKEIIEAELKSSHMLDKSMKKLDEEINNANVVDSDMIPRDVITMNSRVVLHLNEEDIEASLVYPEEADWSAGKLSILSPIGTAILGYREGDSVEWEVPSGKTEIKIKKVIYQPEASGDYQL